MLDDPVSSAPSPGSSAAPRDLAGLALEVEGVVDRRFDHRPELAEIRRVAGGEVVVPGAGRHVARDVGVERRIFDLVADVVRVPAAVGVLLVAQPLVARTRGFDVPAEVERHQRLDQVPRVGVTTRDPREVAVGELVDGDGVDRRRELARGDDAGYVGEAASRDSRLLGVDDEALADDRVQRAVDGVRATPAAPRSATRGSRGTCGRATRSVLSTPTAHFSHQ